MQFGKRQKIAALGLAFVAGLLAAPPTVSAALQIGLQPDELFVNEIGMLIIESDREMPTDVVLPKIEGLAWVGNPQSSQETRTVNGRRSFRGVARYPFTCSRLGRVRIAGVKAREGGKLTELPAVEFTVRERRFTTADNRELTMDDVLYVKASYPNHANAVGDGQNEVFVGESVPLLIEVFAMESLMPAFRQYPALETGNAIVHDYSAVNDASPQFDVGREARRIVGDLRYRVWTFNSRITPLGVGPVKTSGTLSLGISLPGDRRGFFSDFMPMPGGGKIHTLAFKLPELSARAVPAPPDDAGQYLGLIGTWNVEIALSKTQAKVGEPLALTMKIAGDGALNTLKVPQLELPNFRVYDAEVSKDAQRGEVTVTWAIIPLAMQADRVGLAVCSFDSQSRKYRPHVFQQTISVAPGDLAGGDSGGAVFDSGSSSPLVRKPQAASDLLYIKKRPGRGVALPLFRNAAPKAALAMALGALLAMTGGIVRLRRVGATRNEGAIRRRAALKRRGQVAGRIRQGGTAEGMTVAREEAVPLIADLWECPPGTSAGELAQIAEKKCPDLAAMLVELDKESFAPKSGTEGFDTNRFADILKKMPGLMLLALAALVLCRGGAAAQAEDFSAGIAAYDAGDYQQAARIFERLGRADAEDPVLLYSRGNCAFELGRPAEAIALYERARLLAPRDSDISENLDFVRNTVGLAPRGRAQTPGELLVRMRDALRPDEWMTVAAVCVAGALAWLGIAWLREYRWRLAIAILLSASVVFALLAHRQTLTSYRLNGKAVVGSRQAAAFRHPSADSRKTEFIPVFGDCVEIVERRNGWQLIRQPEGEGWIHSEHLLPVW